MSTSLLFAGIWNFESSENFEEFLKAMGIGFVLRKMAATTKPTITITVDGNHYVIKQESAIKTVIIEFDLDVEFDETLADGRQCKSIVKMVGEKLVHDQRSKESNVIIERWVEGDDLLVVTCECKGVKAIRKYKRSA